MAKQEEHPAVWAYGIVEPGWYCAKAVWSQDYANHLKSLGYRVEMSVKKPTIK